MIRVAIAGLGRAGAGAGPRDARPGVVRSHLDAVMATAGLRPTALIDPDPAAQKVVRERWPGLAGTPVLDRLEDMPGGDADVIVLATPADDRRQQVRAALDKAPRLLLVEKPLATSLAEGRELVDRSEAAGVALRVNFHRRFDPGHRRFRDGMPGLPCMVVVRYSKGLFNYAGHAIDLLLDWFGPVAAVQAMSGPRGGADPAISFRCRMEAGFDAVFLGVDGVEFDQFELDFLFPDRRLELANGGVEKRLYRPVDGRFYPGYVQLGAAEEIEPPAQVGGFAELYQAIRDHLANSGALAGCGGHDALRGLAVQESVLASAAAGGGLVALEPRGGR